MLDPFIAAERFDLGAIGAVSRMGGTAAPRWRISAVGGDFVLRIRPAEFCDPDHMAFDHAVVAQLAEAGLPVPRLRRTDSGRTWIVVDDVVCEMYAWLDASPAHDVTDACPESIGRFIARLHQVFADGVPSGKRQVRREDHPDLIEPYVEQLRRLPGASRHDLDAVAVEFDYVREHLDDQTWRALPQTVIHGDLHPGNLHVHGDRIAGLFDFDYVSVQARIRDIVDGLIFFASRRSRPLNTDDIASLVQPFLLDESRCRALLRVYGRLSDAECAALPWALRSRWLQMKLRAIRKVPDDMKLQIALHGMREVIEHIDAVDCGQIVG